MRNPIHSRNMIPTDLVEQIWDMITPSFQHYLHQIKKILPKIELFVNLRQLEAIPDDFDHYSESSFYDAGQRQGGVYLWRVFENGCSRWFRSTRGGGLRRYIFLELVQALWQVVYLAILPAHSLSREERAWLDQDNFDLMHEILAHSKVPQLGLLEVLRDRILNKWSGEPITRWKGSGRILNEYRRQSFRYEFEFAFSELVHAIIFRELLPSADSWFYRFFDGFQAIRNLLYKRLRRRIWKEIKDEPSGTRIYVDRAGRKHLFLDIEVYRKYFNHRRRFIRKDIPAAMIAYRVVLREYFDYDEDAISGGSFSSILLPVFGKLLNDIQQAWITLQRTKKAPRKYSRFLFVDRESEAQIEQLTLDLCEDVPEFGDYLDFLKYRDPLMTCPCCGRPNHLPYIARVFLDPTYASMKNELLLLISRIKKTPGTIPPNYSVGIPCCSCYSKLFERSAEVELTGYME